MSLHNLDLAPPRILPVFHQIPRSNRPVLPDARHQSRESRRAENSRHQLQTLGTGHAPSAVVVLLDILLLFDIDVMEEGTFMPIDCGESVMSTETVETVCRSVPIPSSTDPIGDHLQAF
jgi:hypothetical protein